MKFILVGKETINKLKGKTQKILQKDTFLGKKLRRIQNVECGSSYILCEERLC